MWIRGICESVKGRLMTVKTAFENIQAVIVQQWGFVSSPPAGSDVVVLKDGESLTVICSDGEQRISVKAGETAVYDKAGNVIHLKNDGGIKISSASKIFLQCPNVVIGMEDMAKGLLTEDFLNMMFSLHTHNVTMVGAPSGPPIFVSVPTAVTSTLSAA